MKYIHRVCIFILIVILLLIYISYNNIPYNREYTTNNIYINYPYFNNKNIDSYINKYITSNMESDTLYIDYDYNIINNKYIIDFYIYNSMPTINDNTILNNYNYLNNNYDSYKLVALTFDDGPNYNTNKLLDILEKYNVKATFFVIGSNAYKYKDTIKRMDNLGMQIGNHTYTHKILSRYSKDIIQEEISSTNEIIYNIIGRYPTVFRPSYGISNKKVREVSNMPIITWNIDTLDWKYHSSSRMVNSIMKDISEGDIILMHDIYISSVNAIDKVIPLLLDNGYIPVTIDELFNYYNIKLENNYIYNKAM